MQLLTYTDMTTRHTGNNGHYQSGRATATSALYQPGRDPESPAPSTGKQQKRKEAPTDTAAEPTSRRPKGTELSELKGDKRALPKTIAPYAFRHKWHPDVDPGLVWCDLDKFPLTPRNIAVWLFEGRNSIRDQLDGDRVGVQRYKPAQRYQYWSGPLLKRAKVDCPGSLPLPPLLGLRMGYYLPRAMVFWGCVFHWACFGPPEIVSWDFPGRADWEAKRDKDTFTSILAFHGMPTDIAKLLPFGPSWPTEAAVLWGNPPPVNINTFHVALEHFSERVDIVGVSRPEWVRSRGLTPAPSLATDSEYPPSSPSEDFTIDEDDSDTPPEEVEDMEAAVNRWTATGSHLARTNSQDWKKASDDDEGEDNRVPPSGFLLSEANLDQLQADLEAELYPTGRDSPVVDLYNPGSDLPQLEVDTASSAGEALSSLDDTASELEEIEPTLPPQGATPLNEQGFRWPEDPILPAPQDTVPPGLVLAHGSAACFHCKSASKRCAFKPGDFPSACVRLTQGGGTPTRCRLCSYETFSLEQMHCTTILGIAASRTAPLSDGELSSLAMQLAGVTLFCGYEGTLSTQERQYLLGLQDDTPPAVLQQSAREQANGHWPLVRNMAGPNNGVALPAQLQQSTTAIAGPGTIIDDGFGQTTEVKAGIARMLGLLACTYCRANGHTCELSVDDLAMDRVKCNMCFGHSRSCSFKPSPALKWWNSLARLFYHFSLWVTSEGNRPVTPVARAWFDYFKNILLKTPYLITEVPALPTGAEAELEAAYNNWVQSSYLEYDLNHGDIDPHIPGVVNSPLFFATAPSTL